MSSRREARERAMQAVYAFTIGGDDAEHVMESVIDAQLGTDKEAKVFAKKLFLRTLKRITDVYSHPKHTFERYDRANRHR